MIPSFLKHILRASVAALSALSLMLVSCKPEEYRGDVLTLSADQHNIPKEKGEYFIRISGISAAWNASLEYADEAVSGWASLYPYHGSGNSVIFFKAQANTEEASRTVRVVVTSGEASAFWEITQAGAVSEPEPAPAGGWLELPETPDGKGCRLLVHDMSGKKYVSQAKSGVRNWSCWWCPSEHLSIWVAYPLNNSLIGSGSRTDDWDNWRDPCLEDVGYADQPHTSSKYGGGWARGHQIPSADRYRDAANRSTFYSTNLTPQDYDFNGRIWANLEGAVRGYASKSDTLYVVTGCDIRTNIGLSDINTGFRVKAPGAYWKAVVSYQKSRSVYGGFLGCAYYLPHDTSISADSYIDYIMSIDDLEKKIGIDLFVNLPGKIGDENAAKLEALAPGSFWK